MFVVFQGFQACLSIVKPFFNIILAKVYLCGPTQHPYPIKFGHSPFESPFHTVFKFDRSVHFALAKSHFSEIYAG